MGASHRRDHDTASSPSNSSSSSSASTMRLWMVLIIGIMVGGSLVTSVREARQVSAFLFDYTAYIVPSYSSLSSNNKTNERRDDEDKEKEEIRVTADADEERASEENYEQTKEDDQPMNIVLLYADDWTFRTLGMVNPSVRTPNLDGMARRGMLFQRNCVTTSICWQSRATMMTGMYVSVHKELRIMDDYMFNKTVQWPETLFPKLRSNGYHVGFIGKWHHPAPPEFMSYTFDHIRDYYGEHWMERDGRRRHVTELNGADALNYLRNVRPRDKPFALAVSFFATHADDAMPYPLQFSPMPYTAKWYANSTIPVPKTATEEHWKRMPWFFTESNEGRKRWRLRYDTAEHYQVTMKRYYRMATEVDDVVGAVIKELKRQGVYNNTYIVFTTDNGMFHGEHGLADKWYPHEESIRVPLIIQDPRMPKKYRGTVNDDFTLNIDLAPSLLSAAGIKTPPHMQGRDIADLYLRPQQLEPPWRQDFFYEWSQGRPEDAEGHDHYEFIPAVFALVQKQWKYFMWPQTKYEQVFNVADDPFEENDLLNSTTTLTVQQLGELKARYMYLKSLSQSGHRV